MAKVTFNIDRCKGCGLCVGACPKKIVALLKDEINANKRMNYAERKERLNSSQAEETNVN